MDLQTAHFLGKKIKSFSSLVEKTSLFSLVNMKICILAHELISQQLGQILWSLIFETPHTY